MPLALVAALPQGAPAATQPVPAVIAMATTPADGQPPPPTGTKPAMSRRDPPPELADPLEDPAKQIIVETRSKAPRHYPGDSLEGFNRTMFGISVALDKAIYGPLAMGYEQVLPKPVRSALRNFFRNLSEPVVFLNDLLQLKPDRAARTFARFVINSTVGVGGLIDVAASKGVNLPYRKNGFGNTLAYYGVHAGSYLFLPLVGPTTLRDLVGGPVDGAVLPVVIGKPFTEGRYQLLSGVITGLDLRAEADPEMRALFAGAVDPYATLRSAWLQIRAAEISALHRHGKAPAPPPELENPLNDPAGSSAPAVEPRAQ